MSNIKPVNKLMIEIKPILLASTAVGSLGTNPVVKNSDTTGKPKNKDVNANSKDKDEKKNKGFTSLIRKNIKLKILNPSRNVLNLLLVPLALG